MFLLLLDSLNGEAKRETRAGEAKLLLLRVARVRGEGPPIDPMELQLNSPTATDNEASEQTRNETETRAQILAKILFCSRAKPVAREARLCAISAIGNGDGDGVGNGQHERKAWPDRHSPLDG